MRATRAREIIAAGVGAVLAMSLTMPTAVAAPPSNDDIGHATVIATVPSSVAADTREATTEPDTPGSDCMGGNSVWYRFRPERDFTGRALTANSDFDPVMGIFTGQPRALTLVACSDDTIGIDPGADIRFVRGQTYYIAISTCCDLSVTTGGQTVLNLFEPRPFTFSAPTTRTRVGDISGSAVISGTVRCVNPNPTPVTVTVQVTLRQRIGSRAVRGTGAVGTPCGATTRRWSMVVDGERGLAFRPGRARMTITKSATDGFTNTAPRTTTRTIHLRKARNLLADSTG